MGKDIAGQISYTIDRMKKAGIKLPPRPVEPSPEECCGRGCENCVYVYYERALFRWQEKVAAILSEHDVVFSPSALDEQDY